MDQKQLSENTMNEESGVWLVGASFPESGDQTERFIAEGVWENTVDKQTSIAVASDAQSSNPDI